MFSKNIWVYREQSPAGRKVYRRRGTVYGWEAPMHCLLRYKTHAEPLVQKKKRKDNY